MPQSTPKSSKFPRRFEEANIRILLAKPRQDLKEDREGSDKNFINASSIRGFHLLLFKFFSPQFHDQAYCDCCIITLLICPVNQPHSPNTSNDQSDTDTNKKNEFTRAFTKTEIDTSSGTQVSPQQKLSTVHGHFSNPEDFLSHSVTLSMHYDSLKFDDNAEFSSVRYDTLHVNYAQTDCLSYHTATHPRQDPYILLT